MASDHKETLEAPPSPQSTQGRSSCSDNDIELGDRSGSNNVDDGAEREPDPNGVDWDGPSDPQNPLNWRVGVKWTHIIVVSIMTFFSPLGSTMFAPGAPQVAEEFGIANNDTISALFVSVYLLGWVVGPLVVAPCSELYGRLVVYHVGNTLFVVFSVACALSTGTGMLIAFRFLAGFAGIAPVTNGAATIADLMPVDRRGAAMALWTLGPVVGPIIGPVAGGFIAESLGWRWILWIFTIACGCCTLLGFAVLRETFAPVLLQRKVQRLRRTTGNAELYSKLDNRLAARTQFRRALVRPAKLMCTSIICGLLSLYSAILYGIMFLLFTTFPQVFGQGYGFSEGVAGLTYIGVGVGLLLGLLVHAFTSDRTMKRLARKKTQGEYRPESRLLVAGFLGPFIPMGLIIYGWTANYMVSVLGQFARGRRLFSNFYILFAQIHWIVPIFGTALVGIGLISSFLGILTYLAVSQRTKTLGACNPTD